MMRVTHVKTVEDGVDLEIAQLVHRVGVKQVVLYLMNGATMTYERVDNFNPHLYEDLSCPDCGRPVWWNEEFKDYVHEAEGQGLRCWLTRNEVVKSEPLS